MTGIPIYNINNNGATGGSVIHLAKSLISAGTYQCVLAVDFEKMSKGAFQLNFKDRALPTSKFRKKTVEYFPLEG